MIQIPVKLSTMQDAKHLVQIAENCEYDAELICGIYVVDAKSMLGVFSLPNFDNVKLQLHTDNAEYIKAMLSKMDLLI